MWVKRKKFYKEPFSSVPPICMDVMSSKNLRCFLTVDRDICKENLMHALNFMQVKYFLEYLLREFQNLFVHLILAPRNEAKSVEHRNALYLNEGIFTWRKVQGTHQIQFKNWSLWLFVKQFFNEIFFKKQKKNVANKMKLLRITKIEAESMAGYTFNSEEKRWWWRNRWSCKMFQENPLESY